MPVVRERSESPERHERSTSPDRRDQSAPGPSKKPKMTTLDVQKFKLEKLFADPDKEVQLPTGSRERTLRAPREMMKNVQGSSAGAGSGEFHVYKQSRRREYERLKIMDDKNRALEEQAAFKARQDARDAVADAKTAKNRAKRQKRKAGRKGEGGPDGNGVDGAHGGSKLQKPDMNGARVVFKRPGEDSEDEEDSDNGGVGPSVPMDGVREEPVEVVQPKAVEETKILIHDDD